MYPAEGVNEFLNTIIICIDDFEQAWINKTEKIKEPENHEMFFVIPSTSF